MVHFLCTFQEPKENTSVTSPLSLMHFKLASFRYRIVQPRFYMKAYLCEIYPLFFCASGLLRFMRTNSVLKKIKDFIRATVDIYNTAYLRLLALNTPSVRSAIRFIFSHQTIYCSSDRKCAFKHNLGEKPDSLSCQE